jgi:hypothetical protein
VPNQSYKKENHTTTIKSCGHHQKGTTMPTGYRNTSRPRSLVAHLIHLTGADPITARMFATASGDPAIKRLRIRPAVTARTKKTVTKRHTIAPVLNKKTGEVEKKNVRRRKGVKVRRWTLDQAAQIIAEMKPRKNEYKDMKAAALDAIKAVEEAASAPPLRVLPRHRRWSKRRHRR